MLRFLARLWPRRARTPPRPVASPESPEGLQTPSPERMRAMADTLAAEGRAELARAVRHAADRTEQDSAGTPPA